MNIKRAFLAAVAVLMMPGLVMAQASNNTFSTIISDPMAGSPDMTITCDGGIPLTQTGAVGTTFTVTQLNTGTVCNVDLAGDLNSGYELDYFKCENGAGDTPAPVTDTGCEFTVETGTDAWSAQVWVTSAPVKYSVAVGWVIDPDLADGGIGGDAEVQMSCSGAA